MDKPFKIDSFSSKFTISSTIPIYRYMSIEQFIAMGESQSLVLPKVVSWEDPNEAYYARQFYERLGKHFREKGELEDARIVELQKDDVFNKTYGICFTHEKEESDALWRIYSGQKSCIRIATDSDKLEAALKSSEFKFMYAIGQICYEQLIPPPDFLNGSSISMQIEHFFIKNPPFQYEKEVRAVALMITEQQQQATWPEILEIPVEEDFISQATIDPRSDEWIVKALQSYCRNKNWMKTIQMEKSTLYRKFERQGL